MSIPDVLLHRWSECRLRVVGKGGIHWRVRLAKKKAKLSRTRKLEDLDELHRTGLDAEGFQPHHAYITRRSRESTVRAERRETQEALRPELEALQPRNVCSSFQKSGVLLFIARLKQRTKTLVPSSIDRIRGASSA